MDDRLPGYARLTTTIDTAHYQASTGTETLPPALWLPAFALCRSARDSDDPKFRARQITLGNDANPALSFR